MTEFIPRTSLNFEAIFRTGNINKRTQHHLSKVYAALGGGIVIAGLSGMAADKGFIPLSFTLALLIAAVISEIATLFTGRNSKVANNYLKPGSFLAYAICLGALVGLSFEHTEGKERKTLMKLAANSAVYTFSIFAAFSIIALTTVRRTTIFFGAVIASLVLSIISIFIWNFMLHSLIGLVVGILYVIIDTQMIIHKTENGVFDVFTDAKELFLDLFKIFIEIMKILGKKEKKDD